MEIYAFKDPLPEEAKRLIEKFGGIKVSSNMKMVVGEYTAEATLQRSRLHLAERAPLPKGEELRSLLSRSAESIAPTRRLANCFKFSIGNGRHVPLLELVFMDECELLRHKGVGGLSVMAMRNALRSVGLDFRDHLTPEEMATISRAAVTPREWKA